MADRMVFITQKLSTKSVNLMCVTRTLIPTVPKIEEQAIKQF